MSVSIKKITLLVFLLALSVRVFHLDIPFVEPYNNISRQSMCASVARNFYEHGFNLFYPEVDEGGAGPYLYNVEMPIYSYLMAIGYKLAGGVNEGVARSVSIFFSMALLLFLYLLIRRVGGERREQLALYGLIFASFSPLGVALSRSIQPDITMLSATVGALYTFYRYCETKRIRFYLSSMLMMTFAVLTKAFALYLFLPIIYTAWIFQGKALFKDFKNYLYAGVVSLALLWYVYMWAMGKAAQLPYDPYIYERGQMAVHSSYLKLFSFSALKLPVKILLVHILTPLGVVGCLAGICKRVSDKKQGVFYVWMLSVVIYLLFLWPTAMEHPYYFLPLIPIFAFFFALGMDRLLNSTMTSKFVRSPLVIVPVIALQIFWAGYFYRLLYFIPEERQAIVKTGQLADALIPKEDLVIASWGASPIQLYYSHRKGWALNIQDADGAHLIKLLEDYRQEGAAWYITSKTSEIPRNPVFVQYLRDNYTVVQDTDTSLIVNLK